MSDENLKNPSTYRILQSSTSCRQTED